MSKKDTDAVYPKLSRQQAHSLITWMQSPQKGVPDTVGMRIIVDIEDAIGLALKEAEKSDGKD